ncbi:hypothetical protein HOLleu_35804 [Holothuria leucospilota]|uniref:Uncharacterized protein n=1 Tax=Holothuria leucospilota TaxID=206669 RepID=A0A9Q0YJ09_HOLLE|nr:hypothetical protein HOLleu_35804 [Holothuria leucospilota]
MRRASWMSLGIMVTRLDGAKVGVFEEAGEVGFAGFREGHDGGALESQLGLEVLSDLADEALEGQLADQKLGTLLVTTDLTECDCPWSVTMRLLKASRTLHDLAHRNPTRSSVRQQS